MDACADKALETTVLQTLHAHGFSRASSSAHATLTDLLARYLHLLASHASRHAEHAGRTVPGARDALAALDELGGGMDELVEFVRGEGREMGRYVAGRSLKRAEDLREMGAVIARGVGRPEEPVPLVWGAVPEGYVQEEDEEDEEEEEEEIEELRVQIPMDVDAEPLAVFIGKKPEPTSLPTPPSPAQRGRTPSPPPLPLSPVSNPASPRPSKRQRTSHIPSHLPPFPSSSDDVPPFALSSEPPAPSEPHHTRPDHHRRDERARRERSQTPPPPRHASAAPADYTAPVPYAESTLGGLPTWHLPGPPPLPPPPSSASTSALAIPSIQPSLLAAYHHVLTHPAPAIPPPAPNPAARHRVAMKLVALAARGARWDAPATLFAASQPNLPAVSAPAPSFPLPVEEKVKVEEGESTKALVDARRAAEGRARLPPGRPRDVGGPVVGVVGLVGRQESRIPELAREALSESVKHRTMRLAHPLPLKRASDGQELTYGPGIPAMWNAPPLPPPTKADPTSTLRGTDKEKRLERERANRALPDAKLFATWEYEVKSPREAPKRGKGVVGGPGARRGGAGVNGGVNGMGNGMGNGGVNGGPSASGSSTGFVNGTMSLNGAVNGFGFGAG